jgi:hypothetical protein
MKDRSSPRSLPYIVTQQFQSRCTTLYKTLIPDNPIEAEAILSFHGLPLSINF